MINAGKHRSINSEAAKNPEPSSLSLSAAPLLESSPRSDSLASDLYKMGFTSSNRSSQRAKEVLRRTKSVSKSSSPDNQSKNNLSVRKAGSVQAQQKKTSANFSESELRNLGVDDQINCMDMLSEYSDYMWLSSVSLSSSSVLSSDDTQNIWEDDCLNVSLQDQFSPTASLSRSSDLSLNKGNEAFAFAGSKCSPANEISLVLSRQLSLRGEDVEEVIQLGAVGNEGKDPSAAHSESPYSSSSYKRILFEEPSISNSSCALPSTYVDTTLWDLERVRTEIWMSSLDLEREDSELIEDGEKECDIFDSDFPSPSFSSMRHLQVWSSSSSSLTSVGQQDKVKSIDTDPDEPLFWPFDHNLYSCLDFERFFCPSPLKDDVGLAVRHGSKSNSLRLCQNVPQANRKDIRRLGRITLSSTPKSITGERETRGVGHGSQKTASMPSRLSRSMVAPSNKHLFNLIKRRGRPQLQEDVQRRGSGSC